MLYRLTLDGIEWNEEQHPRDKRGRFGKRKGAMGIAHILEARARKDGLTPRQAERVAEQVARVVATGKMGEPVQVGGIAKANITDGRHTAVLVKEPGTDAWLLTGWENK